MKKVANEVNSRLESDPSAYDRIDDRPWVVREGGTHFACANAHCTAHCIPINADENAAGNIGLRFLRGVEDFRARITTDGKLTHELRYSAIDCLKKDDGQNFWRSNEAALTNQTTRKGKRVKRHTAEDDDEPSDENDESGGGAVTVIRDPSGFSLPAENWYEEGEFWCHIARMVATGLKAANADMFNESDDDAIA